MRDSNELLNTEHRKCYRVEDAEELAYAEVIEDRLIELLHGTKVKQTKGHLHVHVTCECIRCLKPL